MLASLRKILWFVLGDMAQLSNDLNGLPDTHCMVNDRTTDTVYWTLTGWNFYLNCY